MTALPWNPLRSSAVLDYREIVEILQANLRAIAVTNETAAEELERRIRDRAYRIWVDEGQPDGRYLDHWLRAKKEVMEEEGVIHGTEELKPD